MATKLLFVHGTGVREAGYTASLQLILDQRNLHLPGVDVVPCRWGEEVGAQLNFGGASIPTYGDTRGVGVSDADRERALRQLLMQDPCFELGLLGIAQGEQKAQPPSAAQQANDLMQAFHALPGSADLQQALAALGLAGAWPQVIVDIEKSGGFAAARKSPLAGKPPHRQALARALVAALEKASLDAGGPTLDSNAREIVTARVARLLGDDTRGVFGTIGAPFVGLAENITTWQLRRKRGALTDASYPAAGDILVYQSHGDQIRSFIRTKVDTLASDSVFVLAHSLGGIASLEMLIQASPPQVKGLITYGSQAPFFHEIGALHTMSLADKLPSHVPYWINFYDLNDPLSYVGGALFDGRVSDYKVVSDESFPASHSAYLHSREMWLQIAAFVRQHA